eukprot:TRINITY_DN7643_c0_g1_i1.p2 TRINITY_DN7643_c0_g1~~TRINITY_DN7643_c0_g1_i1.p2  ORF type:complete len:376 (-),score=46.10 TRINITY_DN7643_c0_g1_i1:1290-2417(-)
MCIRDSHYRVWNVSERSYDYSLFGKANVREFPFPDHHAPALTLLFRIIISIDDWLMEDPENVAIVHCLAGKGRTGTVISSYLLFSGLFDNPTAASNYFGSQRSEQDLGVQQPSQMRYISYFHKTLCMKPTQPKTRYLRKLIMCPIPEFSHQHGVRLLLQIFQTSTYPEKLIFSTAWFESEPRHYRTREDGCIKILCDRLKFHGDVIIRCFHLQTKLRGTFTVPHPIFRAMLHTAFIDGDCIELGKSELDLGHKDKRISSDFKLQLLFDSESDEKSTQEIDGTKSPDPKQTWSTEKVADLLVRAKLHKERREQDLEYEEMNKDMGFYMIEESKEIGEDEEEETDLSDDIITDMIENVFTEEESMHLRTQLTEGKIY